jgi:hypothetical protein
MTTEQLQELVDDDTSTQAQRYWREVWRVAALIDPAAAKLDQERPELDHRFMREASVPVYVTSIRHPNMRAHVAGRVSICNAYVAARSIVGLTHRLAEDHEIAEYEAQHLEKRKKIEAEINAQTAPIVTIAESFKTLAASPQGTNRGGSVERLCGLVEALLGELVAQRRAEPPAEVPNGKPQLFQPTPGTEFSMEEPRPAPASRRGRGE